ncbi:unnamed protein product [Musa acuminata var. zebrina]
MDLVSKEGKGKVSWRSKVATSVAGSLGRRPASGMHFRSVEEEAMPLMCSISSEDYNREKESRMGKE